MVKSTWFFRTVLSSIVATTLVPGLSFGAKHPTLVRPEKAKCVTCHRDVIKGASVVHPPVADDCRSCHEISAGDDGTTVELQAEEPELCLLCHDDLESEAMGEVEFAHAAVADSCLNCHNPHSSDHPALLVVDKGKLCSACHDRADLNESHNGQLSINGVDCVLCHLPHGGNNASMLRSEIQHSPFAEGSCDACHRKPMSGRVRLTSRGDAVCEACHGDPAEDVGPQGSVHPALIGSRTRAGCLNCHDPHMNEREHLLKNVGNNLCEQCHESITAAAAEDTGHPPASEDCLNCHLPHTSETSNLLVEVGQDLCFACHDGEDPTLLATHLNADLASLDCLSCHSPHGAGNPGLLRRNIHAAIEEGCDTCHEGSSSDLAEDGGPDLCLMCHDTIGEVAAEASVPHGAMEMVGCTECHNPHASKEEKLLKFEHGGECTACHDDKAAVPGEEVVHGIIELVGCRACHEPHGGDNPFLLRVAGDELCLACHDAVALNDLDSAPDESILKRLGFTAADVAEWKKVYLSNEKAVGHPVGGHRVKGKPTEYELKRAESTFEGVFSCLTCHDPHKGKSRQVFQWDVSSSFEVCQQCHPK